MLTAVFTNGGLEYLQDLLHTPPVSNMIAICRVVDASM